MEDSVNETHVPKTRVILVSIVMIPKVLHSLDVDLVQRDIEETVLIVYHLPVNKDLRHVSRYYLLPLGCYKLNIVSIVLFFL